MPLFRVGGGGMGARPMGFGGGSRSGRLIIAAIMAIISLISYFSLSEKNEVTGENQHINITKDQEIALGLQAAPEMIQQYGGELADPQSQELVERIGQKIVASSAASKANYKFDFHVLADPQTINAFALPGGQIFITQALLSRLKTEGQIAGVLGHEIGHVIARHSAEHIAKQQLTQGLTGAAVIASYDPDDPSSYRNAAFAQLIANMVNMKFGRSDELESDKFGVMFMSDAGYDPRAMIEVMKVLAEASKGNRQPEFFSTHPNPENRIAKIQQAIQEKFPDGVPQGLMP